MTWTEAMKRAERLAQRHRARFYVRGWQRWSGQWVYGAFASPRPGLPGRTWRP